MGIHSGIQSIEQQGLARRDRLGLRRSIAGEGVILLREYIREAIESLPVRQPLDMAIPSDLHELSDLFTTSGEELYIVGGAVRDTLLGKTPKDYDLATGASLDAVMDIVSRDPENKTDLTGKAFGVVRVWTPAGNEYEIATFRKDIGAGRRPDVELGATIEDDVQRRDLTVNALFYDMDAGEVVDYVGGLADIQDKRIRAVGDPAERFAEDKLRILRAVRFAARLGSELDIETQSAILDDNDLTEVSPDRIHEELVKGISSAEDVTHFFGLLEDLELYDQIFPGLRANSSTGSSSSALPVQLALLLADNDVDHVRSVLKTMRYTNAEVAATDFLLRLVDIDRASAVGLKKGFGKLELSSEDLQDFGTAAGINPRAIDAFLRFAAAPPAVAAKDLMARGLRGPEVGQAMETAEGEAYQGMLGELRSYIRIHLREQAEASAATRDVDDILDDVIRDAAPEIVRSIREREVDEDIDEFIDGALHGSWDTTALDYPDPPSVGDPAEVRDEGDREEVTETYLLGYEWGWANPGKITRGEEIPAGIRREMIEHALGNFEGRVTEEFVINAVEKAVAFVKRQMGDVHDILKKAKEKFGWKVAPALVGIEVVEHAVLPAVLGAIHPVFYGLAAVPTVEILAASALAIAKARMPAMATPEIPPGHLDWYEGEYSSGTTESLLRKYARTLLTEAARQPEDLPEDVKVVIEERPGYVTVYYGYDVPGDLNGRRTVRDSSGTVWGDVTIVNIQQNRRLGSCDMAWKLSGSEAQRGWGPLLYDVAMEVATIKGNGLMADRDSVSPSARNVWRHYLDSRSDVENYQLDNFSDEITPYIEVDNCDQEVSERDETSHPWHTSPLSKRYTKAPTQIEKLKAMDKLEEWDFRQ
jgi:tRNA nucleotidyltransferase/poly(A) polymerase